MKKLIFLLLLPIAARTQTDTIFKKDKSAIICTITFVNTNNIFFTEKKDPGKFIDVKKVAWYSQAGKRTDPSAAPAVSAQNNIMTLSSPPTDTISAALELEHMKYCFRRYSKQYTAGIVTSFAGIGVSGIGVTISRSDENAGQVIAGAGLLALLVGGIVMIDSHRWIHKAGFGINGKGNSVAIYYTFK